MGQSFKLEVFIMQTLGEVTVSTLLGCVLANVDGPISSTLEKDGKRFQHAMVQGAQTAASVILLHMAFDLPPNEVLFLIPAAVLATHCLKNRVNLPITALTQASNAVNVIALVYFGKFLQAICLVATYGVCLDKYMFLVSILDLLNPPHRCCKKSQV